MPDWLFGVLVIVVVLALFLVARWVSLAGEEAAVRMRGTVLDRSLRHTGSPWGDFLRDLRPRSCDLRSALRRRTAVNAPGAPAHFRQIG